MNGSGRKYITGPNRFFQGDSRSQKRANNNLGVIATGSGKSPRYRSQKLSEVEKYLKNTQYDHLENWDVAQMNNEEHVPLHKRKPKIIFPFARVFADRVSSKLAGMSTFPKLKIEDDPETEFLMNLVINGAWIKPKMLEAAADFIVFNSVFVSFKWDDGYLNIEKYCSNFCYPVFKSNGQLESVTVKYVYDDPNETNDQGKPIQKWFKKEFGEFADILYDNPEFDSTSTEEPEFAEVERAEHGLGYVQGEWISNGESRFSPEGGKDPFVVQIKDFIDALNYNLSQTHQATAYGMDPQLLIKGLSEEEVDELIKGSGKAWLMGREGEATYLEAAGSGLDQGKNTRDDFFKRVQDIARIVLLDPEKMVANAQSGKAMEVMHGPMVELINELRPWFEKGFISLMEKIMGSLILLNQRGLTTQFVMPPMYAPKSLDIKAMWPPIFELTIQDMQQLVSIGLQVANGNIVSRDTIGKWLAGKGVDFGVEDWDLERQKVDSQKQFGGFF
jgi:hypothetical protein